MGWGSVGSKREFLDLPEFGSATVPMPVASATQHFSFTNSFLSSFRGVQVYPSNLRKFDGRFVPFCFVALVSQPSKTCSWSQLATNSSRNALKKLALEGSKDRLDRFCLKSCGTRLLLLRTLCACRALHNMMHFGNWNHFEWKTNLE